jgi:hypothetical protein
MIGTGTQGFNALQIILASGFPATVELGEVPDSVAKLAGLPEHVRLVRADESFNFHLAAKSRDSIRNDTTIFRWLVSVAPNVVQTPDHYRSGSKSGQFQLFKRVQGPEKYPERDLVQLFIKIVPAGRARSGIGE